MILTSVDDSPILDPSAITRALVGLFGEGSVAVPRYDETPYTEVAVDVDPPSEPSFTVRLGKDRSDVGIDGMLDQNVRVVVALRAAIPADTPRIVALDPKLNAFVDLPAGVTVEQIAAGWRDFSEFESDQAVPVQVVSVGSGGYGTDGFATKGSVRGAWVVPSWAPRPQVGGVRRLDQQPGALVPGTKYEARLPGGIEVDYFTDPAGRVCYIETVPGTAAVPNPTLDVPQVSTTYVIHPVDGRFAVVLLTDEQARLVEVVADPVAPVGSYGSGGHPLVGLLGGWPGRVSPAALLGSVGASVGEGLGRLGAWLVEAVGRGQHVQVRLQVFYEGAGAVPAGVRADWSVDGQAATESFADA